MATAIESARTGSETGSVKLSKSTSHRMNRPAVIALALAALRLGLHLPAKPQPAIRRPEPQLF